MLRENQISRPNIYQVLRESCSMQGREIPIHDVCPHVIASLSSADIGVDLLKPVTVVGAAKG